MLLFFNFRGFILLIIKYVVESCGCSISVYSTTTKTLDIDVLINDTTRQVATPMTPPHKAPIHPHLTLNRFILINNLSHTYIIKFLYTKLRVALRESRLIHHTLEYFDSRPLSTIWTRPVWQSNSPSTIWTHCATYFNLLSLTSLCLTLP